MELRHLRRGEQGKQIAVQQLQRTAPSRLRRALLDLSQVWRSEQSNQNALQHMQRERHRDETSKIRVASLRNEYLVQIETNRMR
mmetsp:Transcript_49621/g.78575  ORF Transcript_49621/g.78575 Transcript_49621/m.78575 type:complete len:84 (-) Transcript_49621:31-282(-)